MNLLELYPDVTPDDHVIYLNSTSLRKLACPRAFQLHNTAGLKLLAEPEPLTVGKAIHKFAEVFDLTSGRLVDALEAATNEYPSVPTATIIAAGGGRKRLSLPPPMTMLDGTPGLEYYFAVPYQRWQVGEVTYVIVLCGTLDRLSYHNGVVRLYDYKTSRKYKLDDIEAQYKFDAQQRFYLWNIVKHGARFLLPDAWEAARQHHVSSNIIAVQIGKVENPKWHLCPEILMPVAETNELTGAVDVACEYAVQIASNPDIVMPLGKINGTCGGANNYTCDFAPLCYARSADEMARAEALYHKIPYNPQHHNIV